MKTHSHVYSSSRCRPYDMQARDEHFPKLLHLNIRAQKNEYSNIRLFMLGLMRKTLFLISKFLSWISEQVMISRYSTMFYNNVTLYRKVLFGWKHGKKNF